MPGPDARNDDDTDDDDEEFDELYLEVGDSAALTEHFVWGIAAY